ncbi:MAG TPA: UDP-N-acetylmuramoyl-L-alanyl-D-glutamate--2,6-diaminopimelate ligase [Tepidisphaeraceae bacterium]|nr:UDP-N-acetylmuramoyl-L-alanyl-D-glutamate--2,6-diaminopimelate ligase [Tepidisphaeraceae bacterium]
MQLHALLRHFDPQLTVTGIPASAEITGVTDDSRRVQPGFLFVARPGQKSDGARFLADAKAKGAVAVITQTKQPGAPLPQVVIQDAARAASVLANLFHGTPSLKMRTFAITGTNGKTTTAYLVRHLLGKVSQRCGLIGTVEVDDGRTRRPADMTTPDPCAVAETLATMRDRGCRAAVLEASSHALAQSRLAGVFFSGAAFTNLTGDHLDYHQTMENYASAKARLFETLDAEAVAVVNADDKWSDRMIQDCPSRIMRFGFSKRADYRASNVQVTAQGSRFLMHTPDGKAEVSMKLIGKHNIENALTAAALVGESCGLTVSQMAAGLSDAEGAPGRLQLVDAGQPFSVLVDYAHSDDALENVLSALRPITQGKLRVMFGCGGDRDPSKRPRMAKVAEKLADVVYVTSDNPRTEDPNRIIDQIRQGLSKNGAGKAQVVVEPDRRAAIERIIADAEPNDVVLLAGKGHEDYQIIGTTKHHFDDVEEARRCLQGQTAAA